MQAWSKLPARLGAGWMIIAASCFASMSMFAKLGAPHFSSTELLFYRSLFGWVSVGSVAAWHRQSVFTRHWHAHAWRSVIGFAAIACFFYALTHLPLGTAVTLNYTSSLFFALICIVVLRERPKLLTLLALAVGFSGIVLLLKPTFNAETWLASCVGLLSGLFAGTSLFNVRELGQMGEPEWRTVFWFTGVSTIIGFVVMLFDAIHPVTLDNSGILLGLGVSATLGQLAMTRAYKVGSKFLAASFGYFTVVFSVLIGAWLWGDVVHSEALLAIVCIIASGLLAARQRNAT